MKGTSALALLASMATVNAFMAPPAVSRPVAGLRMSAADKIAEAASDVVDNVVDAAGLNVRKPPGDVKLDQGVMDR